MVYALVHLGAHGVLACRSLRNHVTGRPHVLLNLVLSLLIPIHFGELNVLLFHYANLYTFRNFPLDNCVLLFFRVK